MRKISVILLILALIGWLAVGFFDLHKVGFPENWKLKNITKPKEDGRLVKDLPADPKARPSFERWNYYGIDLSLEMESFWNDNYALYLERKDMEQKFQLGYISEDEFEKKESEWVSKIYHNAYDHCGKIIKPFREKGIRCLPFGRSRVYRTACCGKGFSMFVNYEFVIWDAFDHANQDAGDHYQEVAMRNSHVKEIKKWQEKIEKLKKRRGY